MEPALHPNPASSFRTQQSWRIHPQPGKPPLNLSCGRSPGFSCPTCCWRIAACAAVRSQPNLFQAKQSLGSSIPSGRLCLLELAVLTLPIWVRASVTRSGRPHALPAHARPLSKPRIIFFPPSSSDPWHRAVPRATSPAGPADHWWPSGHLRLEATSPVPLWTPPAALLPASSCAALASRQLEEISAGWRQSGQRQGKNPGSWQVPTQVSMRNPARPSPARVCAGSLPALSRGQRRCQCPPSSLLPPSQAWSRARCAGGSASPLSKRDVSQAPGEPTAFCCSRDIFIAIGIFFNFLCFRISDGAIQEA